MKFLKNVFLVVGMIFCLGGTTGFACNIHYDAFEEIRVDGSKLELEDTPFSMDGYRMLPIRNICESMGYQVSWDGSNNQVKIQKNEDELVLTIDSDVILVNNEEKRIRFSPKLVNGRTYVIPAVVQIGLGDEVNVDRKGDFCIKKRADINNLDGVHNVRKVVYKYNQDGLVIGVAQVNRPCIDNPDCRSQIDNINKRFNNMQYSDDELKDCLRELEACEFVDTIYHDIKVVLSRKDVVSVENNITDNCAVLYAPGAMPYGAMYYKKTGEDIKISEIFKNCASDDKIKDALYGALKNAYEKGENKEEVEKVKNMIRCFGGGSITTDEEAIHYIADSITGCIRNNVSGMESWISELNGELILNFADYLVRDGGNCSIRLLDMIDQLNPNFVEAIIGEDIDPVLWLVDKEEPEKNIELMAFMNVENNIKEYEGKYKLDVVRTFGVGRVKAYDENKINSFGLGEDEISLIYDVTYEGRGGTISSNAFLYLKTALSVESENIEGKDYLVVDNGTKVYWEKLS